VVKDIVAKKHSALSSQHSALSPLTLWLADHKDLAAFISKKQSALSTQYSAPWHYGCETRRT